MFSSKMSAILLRRWYLVILGVSITGLLCLLATVAVPVRYSASAEILLLPPEVAVGEGGNPYSVLGDLGPAVDVLSRAMTDPVARQELRAAGVTGTFEVVPDSASPAPLVLVTVEAESPASALSSLELLLDRAPKTLETLQDELDVARDAVITTTVLTQSTRPTPVRKPQIRALLVAGVAGTGATLFWAAAIDAWLIRRRRRDLDHPFDENEALSPEQIRDDAARPSLTRISERPAAKSARIN